MLFFVNGILLFRDMYLKINIINKGLLLFYCGILVDDSLMLCLVIVCEFVKIIVFVLNYDVLEKYVIWFCWEIRISMLKCIYKSL